jgi:hypothetical protein
MFGVAKAQESTKPIGPSPEPEPEPEPEPGKEMSLSVNNHSYWVAGTNADYWVTARKTFVDENDGYKTKLWTAKARIVGGHLSTELEGDPELLTQLASDLPSFPEKPFG